MQEPMLKVGDVVWWSHIWGTEPPKKARIRLIELVGPWEKEGFRVESVTWNNKNAFIVSLDNGHWAYGYQLNPLEGE